MEQRPPGYSLIVTVIVLGVLVIVGFLYKMGKNQEEQAEGSSIEDSYVSVETEQVDRPILNAQPPSTSEVPWEYEVLLECQLVDSWGNDGSTFRVKHRDQEYIFQLYFADAPETSMTNPDRVREQSRHFDYISEQRLLESGQEAREMVHRLLQQGSFTVFTRWEKVLQTPRFYGFIYLQGQNGERRFLSEMLAMRGYASISEHGRKLPNGTEEDSFRNHLRGLNRAARQSKVGAWRRDGA